MNANNDRHHGLEPPQFGLTAMFVVIGILAALFALIHYVGPYGTPVLILFALCVAAHVAGNALGTRLRDGPQSTRDEKAIGSNLPPRQLSAADFAPRSQLSQRFGLGRGIVVTTLVGIVSGGVVGVLGTMYLAKTNTPWVVIALGGLAAAVLGGIWSFAATSFLRVMLSSVKQASQDSPSASSPSITVSDHPDRTSLNDAANRQ